MNRSLRRLALCGLALMAVCSGTLAQTAGAFELVTAAEAQRAAEAEAQPEVRTRQLVIPKSNASAPGIRVISPQTQGATVTAPLRLEVAFTPTPGTRIVPASFRVLYGLLKIDLTERLRKHATVTESGLVVDRAMVPDGQHRLIIQVGDDQGNTAEQEIRVRVGTAS